jgi:hypothetical protein
MRATRCSKGKGYVLVSLLALLDFFVPPDLGVL